LEEIFRVELIEGAKQLGIELSAEQVKLMERQADLVTEHNERAGLTQIQGASDMAIKHFVDSLTCVHLLPPTAAIADIGSGAGLPGVPIALMNPAWKVTLVESSVKKAEFLKVLRADMGGLFSVETTRAEDFGRGAGREAFDVVIARAVARMNVLLEYCLPIVKKGGIFIAMKGPAVDEELEVSKDALSLLGGAIEQVEELRLPLLGDQRRLVVVRKTQHTPQKYPRKTGSAAKNPL
jgi:16S rRNA (guanine527-N7)-methyltransferase